MILAHGSYEDFEMRKLEGEPPFGFDCGAEEQNSFLYEHAWRDQQDSLSTTYLFLSDDEIAAYMTVMMDALPLSRKERGAIPYRFVSACKLAQLGVHRRFQGMGIGQFTVGHAMDLAREVGSRVACRYVTLDSQPDLVDWYGRVGFVVNRSRQSERVEEALRYQRDPSRIAVSMRFDLRPA